MATKPIYSDIKHTFIKDGQGGIKLALNGEAVRTSLINILLTRRGARVMHPEFGASLEAMLFENFNQDIANRISQVFRNEITKWDPRIILRNMVYEPNLNSGIVNLTIAFSIKGDDTVMDLTIPIGGK